MGTIKSAEGLGWMDRKRFRKGVIFELILWGYSIWEQLGKLRTALFKSSPLGHWGKNESQYYEINQNKL